MLVLRYPFISYLSRCLSLYLHPDVLEVSDHSTVDTPDPSPTFSKIGLFPLEDKIVGASKTTEAARSKPWQRASEPPDETPGKQG